VWKLNAAIWLFSAAMAFVPIHLGWNTADGRVQNVDRSSGSVSCLFEVNRTYALLVAVGTYFGPLLIMAVVYFRVLQITRRQVGSIKYTCERWVVRATCGGLFAVTPRFVLHGMTTIESVGPARTPDWLVQKADESHIAGDQKSIFSIYIALRWSL
jgi:hypothetical protein